MAASGPSPAPRARPASTGPSYQSALVIDVESGQVLFQKDPHAPRAPASLAKMMLELLTLEAIRAGDLSLYDTVVVPAEVKTVRGSRVRLRVGETVTVRDLLQATAIASANDAATALAIKLAGSTEACVARMNRRARELGMLETVYHNVHGLDRSDEPGNITTAWDLSILGAAADLDAGGARDLEHRPDDDSGRQAGDPHDEPPAHPVPGCRRSQDRVHGPGRLLPRFDRGAR